MIGLIKKDFLMIKGNLKLVVLIFFVFFLMSLQGQFDMSFAPAMVSVMLFMSTFSYDEYNKWDAYAVTLPNARKNIVKSKYLATFLLILLSVFITFLLNILVGIINKNLNLEDVLSVMLGCTFGILLVESIMYPLIFKYGIEKGRIGLFIGSFVIVGAIGFFSKMISVPTPSALITFLDHYFLFIFPLIVGIPLILSYKISEKIYLKKEF